MSQQWNRPEARAIGRDLVARFPPGSAPCERLKQCAKGEYDTNRARSVNKQNLTFPQNHSRPDEGGNVNLFI